MAARRRPVQCAVDIGYQNLGGLCGGKGIPDRLIVEAPNQSGHRIPGHHSLRYPIDRDGEFIGCASANVTMDILSRFLLRHRTSANSITIIADPTDGKDNHSLRPEKRRSAEDGKLQLARLDTIADDNVREAYRLRVQTNRGPFCFPLAADRRGVERIVHPVSEQLRAAVGGRST